MAAHRPAECRMLDGTIIKGLFYATEKPAPAIIMSHGFNCVKEMTLPDVAETFHSSGFNVFLYDARSVGASGGEPRNLLDPLRMAEDLSDSRNIALWGMSFGAAVSACTAAIDRRPKAVVMVCPLFTYVQPHLADKAFNLLIKDRVSQLRGNEPYSLAPFTPRGENPIGMGGAGGPGGVESYNLMTRASQLGHPDFRDRISLQTYQKLAMWRPMACLDMVRAPVMMVIPELDNISSPSEQQEAFDKIKSPKKLHLAKGAGHLSILTGEGSSEIIIDTVRWLREAFGVESD